jgi:hypothetical protein
MKSLTIKDLSITEELDSRRTRWQPAQLLARLQQHVD